MEVLAHRAPWYVAGPLMGMLILGLRAVLNKPFGAIGGYIDLAENIRLPSQLGFRTFLLLGFVAGGVIYAMLTGQFHFTLSYGHLDQAFARAPAVELGILMGSGILMGFGARWAGGCTSGHGMCGTSLGSPASFVASATFFATGVVVSHILSLMGMS
jgi:uncharacterized membrane protein YedE/YeeE